MPTCKNDPTKKYKGTEPSPKGMGWCAHGEKEGKVRKGKDGNQWIVKKVKNGSKRWIKKENTKLSKKNDILSDLNVSQMKTINLLKNEIKKDLKKFGVKLYIEKLKRSGNLYFTNLLFDNKDSNEKFIIVVFKLDNNKLYIPDKKLYCQHNGLVYSTKKDVITIFKKYLGNKFKWDGKTEHTISIKL